MNQIKVLIVEDSPLTVEILEEVINSDPELTVIGVARNGRQAVELVSKLKPDIISMDINMPEMDGFEATKQIMAYSPTPILVVSAAIKGEVDKVFKAISYGALDVVEKGSLEKEGYSDSGCTIHNIIAKLKFLAKVKVIHHPLAKLEKPRPLFSAARGVGYHLRRIVGIAASTGGPRALLDILKSFSTSFPCGIVIVQHISAGFTEGLVDWLGKECLIKIKIPQDKEEIKPACAYIAPFGLQMRVTEDGTISLNNDPPFDSFKPSGSVLLDSVAQAYKEGAIGVILTGMGSDGVFGLKSIKREGGFTIAEAETTAAVFGMPKAAIEAGVIDQVLPLDKIAEGIIKEL